MGHVLITPQELSDLMGREPLVLIDTRGAAAYAEAHIEGAVNIPEIFTYLASSTAEGERALREKFVEAFGRAGLSGCETAIVYEQSMTGGFGQSCRGYVLLRHFGYPSIKVLHGGFAAWRAAGLPVSHETPHPQPQIFPGREDAGRVIVDVAAMRAAISYPKIVKLDVRDVDEWIGESSSPYGKDFAPRKGRIPGAVWLEWYRMMKPSPQGPVFKSRPELLAECATVGITPETPVIVYCFKGARAANTFIALEEAGIRNVRIYFGSWNEWSRDPALPIEEGYPFSSAA